MVKSWAERGISADEPDWSREHKRFFEWQPGKSLLAAIRAYQRSVGGRGPVHFVTRRWAAVRHRIWSVVTGADIPLGCRIGGGLMLPHPNGIVFHPEAVVGVNCMFFHQVTLGYGTGGVPVVGGGVDIGAGAKVIGKIMVGDHAIIGANAVVLSDVPAGATAVGIPARIVSGAR